MQIHAELFNLAGKRGHVAARHINKVRKRPLVGGELVLGEVLARPDDKFPHGRVRQIGELGCSVQFFIECRGLCDLRALCLSVVQCTVGQRHQHHDGVIRLCRLEKFEQCICLGGFQLGEVEFRELDQLLLVKDRGGHQRVGRGVGGEVLRREDHMVEEGIGGVAEQRLTDLCGIEPLEVILFAEKDINAARGLVFFFDLDFHAALLSFDFRSAG